VADKKGLLSPGALPGEIISAFSLPVFLKPASSPRLTIYGLMGLGEKILLCLPSM